MNFKNIHFILSQPQLGENIGASARAIKNFNFSNLRIVNPRDGWPNLRAQVTSVGAKNILKSAKICKSLDKAITDLDMVFAATSRIRKVNKKTISIKNIKKIIKKNQKIGIIFGSEASGLSNSEASCADYIVKIPTSKYFSSINLSHSVIIFCYELFNICSKANFRNESKHKNITAKKQEVTKFINFILKCLYKIGFLQPHHKKQSMIDNIKNIFYRNNLSDKEIRILSSIFGSLYKRKIKKLN